MDGESWKIVLPCTRAEGEALALDPDLLPEYPEEPVILTREADPAHPDQWILEAYFQKKPGRALLNDISKLVPSAAGIKIVVEKIIPEDWVTLSQAGLEPVHAGRFFVYTAAHADAIPEGSIAFAIEASQAFGTGQHETTTGCLMMLDRLKRQGARYDNIVDVGTGTGLLAFGAHRLWPRAHVIASDIDPIAIDVAYENAEVNNIRTGNQGGMVEMVTAAGLANHRLRRRIPYDLIIANILAGPLIDLAPVLAAALAPGGSLILAGLLDHQAAAVSAAYRKQGMRLADRIDRAEWPSLRLVKRHRPARIKRAG